MVIISCFNWHTPQAFVLPAMGPGLDAAAGTARIKSDLDLLVIRKVLEQEL